MKSEEDKKSNPLLVRVLTVLTALSILSLIIVIILIFNAGTGLELAALSEAAKWSIYATAGLSFVTAVIGWSQSKLARTLGIIGLLLIAALYITMQILIQNSFSP